MLEKIIRKRNDDIAYIINDEKISYKDLYENAKYYGQLLQKQGTSPVIIYGHKSIGTFLSMFSCLFSGRAYIPIDLCTPEERIRKIIETTKCKLILTEYPINIESVEIISLNDLIKYENVDAKEISNDIAYIIFTSGSTGEPKGVPISQSNLLNFTNWINGLYPLCEYNSINVLNQASFSFDLSIADIFYSISNGHSLIALDSNSQNNYNDIFKKIIENNINVLVVTPTFIKLCLLNKEFNYLNYPSIKCIYFCGEQLEVRTVKQLFNNFPNINIINAYGPTEATSAVSAVNITKNMLDWELLPCGIKNNFATSITIENDEIILKGSSVFSGYLGDQIGGYYKEKDINCFRTGDIGYFDNNFLYCKGRKDNQIKYKGYRIELSDIENNIYKIEGVKECSVIAKYTDNYLVKMIKAYVVLEDSYTVDYVKTELKKYIPAYMMPKIIIKIDSMPINCNGKIDKKELAKL